MEESQSFLGLVNYVGKWIANLATLTEPLRELLKHKLGKGCNVFPCWKTKHTEAFNRLKYTVAKKEALGYYDLLDKSLR